MARREKKPVHHVQMTDGKRAIIQQLLQEYDIETAEDIQDALKDLLGGTIKEMMEAEMDDHLGYGKSERVNRDEQSDYRNGTKRKQVNTSYGSMTIDVPQDRNSTFEPQVVRGGRTFSWTGYAARPRFCRYSQGLIFPSDVLILFVLYHSKYSLKMSINSDILTPVQS